MVYQVNGHIFLEQYPIFSHYCNLAISKSFLPRLTGQSTFSCQLRGGSPVLTMAEEVTAVVAKTGDFKDNEMREVDVGGTKVLLIKQNGVFSAIGSKCTHYAAPLVKGCLGQGRVRCPWHGACFNIKTGDIEDFPGLDGLQTYKVVVEGEDVVVKADKKSLESHKRTGICPFAPKDGEKTFLIIGGGPAGLECAETLRREGFKGKVILASRENVLPYDRPKLSKAMSVTAESIALRAKEFYSTNGIDLRLGKEATKLNLEERKVTFADGESLSYDSLLLATGSKPFVLPVAGFDLQNVLVLREPSQANEIAREATGKRVIVIGTSFIGMEATAYLAGKAAKITCVDMISAPFVRVLGEKIGAMVQKMFEEKGVEFRLGSGVKELKGTDGKFSSVVLSSGETLEGDLCVAGVGVVPATAFLKDSGLSMTKMGHIIVDKHLKAAAGVYAAGDVAQFPLPLVAHDTNIGHWQVAHKHGNVAALNMLGKETSFDSIPFFWTVLFNKSLRYCGHALKWDEIIYNGSVDERKFVAYYVKDDKVLAVCSLDSDPAVAQAAELMYQSKMPSGSLLKKNSALSSYL
eukprot:Em0005g1592a